MPAALDTVYSAIGQILTDDDVVDLVKQATGQDLYVDFASEKDTRKDKIRKTIEALQRDGNERWLLTYVLIRAVAQEKLCRKIVDAFPKTLVGLPLADGQVTSALAHLHQLLNTPFPPGLKYELKPKRTPFAKIVQAIVTLVASKNLHECLLKLLFALRFNEALSTGSADHVGPNLPSIVRQIDDVLKEAPVIAAMLGDDAAVEKGWIDQLTQFAVPLRTAVDASGATAATLDGIRRLVRMHLARLNGKVFAAAQNINFDALTHDLPENIEDNDAFKELVQAMRDVTTTILARVFKHKMWQDAENQISLIGNFFDSADDATGIAEWFKLQDRVNWLSKLDPDETWGKQGEEYASEVSDQISKEEALSDDVRMHFETYRSWFRDPFLKIDDLLRQDFGSLDRIPDPLTKIVNELPK